jgi:hypothetical protein
MAVGIFGGVLGGMIGVTVGTARRVDRWEPVALAGAAGRP